MMLSRLSRTWSAYRRNLKSQITTPLNARSSAGAPSGPRGKPTSRTCRLRGSSFELLLGTGESAGSHVVTEFINRDRDHAPQIGVRFHEPRHVAARQSEQIV